MSRTSEFTEWCRLVDALDPFQASDMAETNNPSHECGSCDIGALSWVDCALIELEHMESQVSTREDLYALAASDPEARLHLACREIRSAAWCVEALDDQAQDDSIFPAFLLAGPVR